MGSIASELVVAVLRSAQDGHGAKYRPGLGAPGCLAARIRPFCALECAVRLEV
jgi:hypothetical protein